MSTNKDYPEGKLRDVIGREGVEAFGNALLESFEELGLGVLSKSDFETFMYHVLKKNVKPNQVKDNYDWMRLLKVTPSKLSSLQMNESAKYGSLDLEDINNWKEIYDYFKEYIFSEGKMNRLRIEHAGNQRIKFFVGKIEIFRLIERFAFDNGSSLDYKRNAGQVVMELDLFLALLDKVLRKNGMGKRADKLVTEIANLIGKEITELNKKGKETADLEKVKQKVETGKQEESGINWLAKGIDFTSSLASNIISGIILKFYLP